MKITFANDYTTPGGRTYKSGTTAEIKPNGLARSLILRGKAVEAAGEGSGPAPKKRAGTSSAAAEETSTPDGDKGKD